MTESTSEYKKRIEEIKQSIENEPYMAKMREDIAEGISKTGIRQATVEEQFQAVIDETTGKDVISAPEIILARGGATTLGERLDESDAQLAQTETEIKKITANPKNYKGAVLTFIDDNAERSFLTTWKPIADEKNIRVGIAATTDWVGTSGYLTIQELLDLQADGYEVYSHTKTHLDDWVGATDEKIHTELSVSKKFLQDNGFKGHDVLIYSSGISIWNYRVKDIVRQYYDYAVTVTARGVNQTPVDNWAMLRSNTDSMTLAEMKAELDEAIANGGWLVFLSHSFNFTAESPQKYKDFIDYAKSKGVPILPFKEAEKLKGNVVAQGERLTSGSFISKDGGSTFGVVTATSEDMDAPATAYKLGTITVNQISGTNDTIFGKGGILITYAGVTSHGHTYQTFRPYLEDQLYMRYFKTDLTWSDFKPLTTSVTSWGNMSRTINEYPNGHTVHTVVNTSDIVSNRGGTLHTHKHEPNQIDRSYQMFVNFRGEIFVRYWNIGTNAWNDFTGVNGTRIGFRQPTSELLKPITDYRKNEKTICTVSDGINSPAVGQVGGMYKVYRSEFDHYSYAEYKPYNSNSMYRRSVDTSGNWLAWEKVSAV